MKIAFVASPSALAQEALQSFIRQYGQSEVQDADVVVPLGGDGKVLKTLYDVMEMKKPVFAIRRTESVGFLCNDHSEEPLIERLKNAQQVALHPLSVETKTVSGKVDVSLAINEVSIIRETPQSARLRVTIDGIERINSYSGDGVLVATPAGSTAYNHSSGGPIMPLDSNTLVITAVCGFRPRGWSYAVLPQDSVVEIQALETDKRPIRVEAGYSVIHGASAARIWLDREKTMTLLFDPDQHLGERIIREQFMSDHLR